MALKRVLKREEYDQLPDAIKEHYKLGSGETDPATLDLTLEPGEVVGNSQKITGALSKEREAKMIAEKALKAYKDFGDPETIANALAELEMLKQAAAAGGDNASKQRLENLEKQLVAKYETQTKQLTTKFSAEKTQLETELRTLDTQLSDELIVSRGRAAINKHKGREPALLPVLKQFARVVKNESDGRRLVQVLDDNGQPRLSQKANDGTTHMDLDEFVESLKSDQNFAPLFDGVQTSGSGAGGTSRTGSPKGPHIITSADANDVQKYRQARDAAQKAGVPLQIKG